MDPEPSDEEVERILAEETISWTLNHAVEIHYVAMDNLMFTVPGFKKHRVCIDDVRYSWFSVFVAVANEAFSHPSHGTRQRGWEPLNYRA